jgi:hypothetical protein
MEFSPQAAAFSQRNFAPSFCHLSADSVRKELTGAN